MSAGFLISIPMPAAPSGVQFRRLAQAVREAGELQMQEWRRLADGEIVNRLTGNYIQGLRDAESFQYPYDSDNLAVGVFNVAKHAGVIEHGSAAFNLASRIRWGHTPKSKLSKRGVWYINIPFNHATPPRAGEGASVGREKRAMPGAVYNLARKLEPGERLTGRHNRIATETGRVPGGRRGVGPGRGADHPLGPAAPAHYLQSLSRKTTDAISKPTAKSAGSFAAAIVGARESGGAVPSPMHTTGRYEGMFRSGAPGHSQYTTIRTITQRSQWWIPARAGHYVARKVAETTDPIIRGMFEEAFAADVEAAVSHALGGG